MFVVMMASHRNVLGTGGIVRSETYLSSGGVSEIDPETHRRVLPVLAIRALMLGVAQTFWDTRTEVSAVGKHRRSV